MPKLITTPFAVNGQKNEITVNTPESDNSATYDVGFPPITSLPIASGGKPPKGADFNGLFYDITDNIAYLTLGNGYVFNTGLSYPLNARINRTDGVSVRSTVANNTTNPNTSMVGWEIDSLSPSQNLLELTDKAVARTNLGVYSKAETDGIAGTPNATEAIAGKAKIATIAIAQAGANDTDFLTAKKLRDALNATGEAPVSACRAWVNFGVSGGVITVKGSLNIASVTRVSAGIYTVNFSTPMPVENYAVFVSNSGNRNYDSRINAQEDISDPTIKTVNSVQVAVSGTASFGDTANMSVGVFC